MREKIETLSPLSTKRVGEILGKKIRKPFPILLSGDLGVGKTVFVRGLAEGLRSPSRVKSPSFTILYIYKNGRFPIYHFDLYRLDKEGIDDLIKDGYFDKEGIIVIEWAEKFPKGYFSSYLEVKFSLVDENTRVLTLLVEGGDKEIESLIREVVDEYSRN